MMKYKSTITAERLRELLRYDGATGHFYRLTAVTRAKVGDQTGYRRPDGYVVISVDGELYVAHRLAWLWTYGEWPADELDHADRNRSNNAIGNLRAATKSQNQANRQGLAACGFKGVHFDESGSRNKRWCASARVNGKLKNLGRFATAEEAHAAYIAGSLQFHGEFARAA